MTLAELTDAPHDLAPEPLSADEFAALQAILNYLRSRHDTIPTWEFCEGFMAALICCLRAIAPEEYLPVLLAVPFANAVQQRHFMSLWTRRWQQVAQALDSKIEALTGDDTEPAPCGRLRMQLARPASASNA